MRKNLLNVRNVAMSLYLDWATHKAAKYAVEHWHYSRCMPSGKLGKVGVWENKKFIGVVIFGNGSNPNIGSQFGLQQTECCELVRIALRDHIYPVSKIISISLRVLQKSNPGLRLVVSYADTLEGHHGGIYQAGTWLYVGLNQKSGGFSYLINGKWVHKRSLGAKYGRRDTEYLDSLFPNAKKRKDTDKHKYLIPLDKAMRKQIEPLSKPYPKREKQGNEGFHPLPGGATPTLTLQAI